ncbi:MAG: FAD-binding protein [Elusimicrobia bacterium]|nr:FAD-binding protein [Elusimicrobiota bacterium]
MAIRNQRFERISREIQEIVGAENVFTENMERVLYSYDASMTKAMPEAVIKFGGIEQISPVVKILYKNKVPYVPRAAGTNLSGGCSALRGGAVLNLSALDRIYRIDTTNRYAVVECGVVNQKLQNELAKFGYFYAPDPASQKVSTIGGNIGENAGGPQCLKYGTTFNNVLKLEIVTPEGEEVILSVSDPGPDLAGLFVGSEGTFGIVKKAWLKILPLPKILETAIAYFADIESSIKTVTEIISAGLTPRALEAMDRLSLEAAAKNSGITYPQNAGAALVIELDGESESEISSQMKKIEKICAKNFCINFNFSSSAAEREKIWNIRKGAYPAMARLAPNVLVEDGVVPRPRLPAALKEIKEIISKHKLRAGFLFHAGDGNLHPNIIFDERDIEETRRVKKAGYEILKACIMLEGSISGEHGVGVEKRIAMSWLYDKKTLDVFRGIKQAFDPLQLANPDKIIPIASDKHAKPLRSTHESRGEKAEKLINEIKFRHRTGIKTAIASYSTKIPGLHLCDLAPDVDCQKIEGLKELNEIIDFDRDNFTIKVETGISVAELKKRLLPDGFYLDVPDMNGSMGGLIATKSSPDIRDILLGAEILLPDGTVCEFGGKTLKNAAGYNVTKLLCGSWGAFGIILTATLRLSPYQTEKPIPLSLDVGGAPQHNFFKPNDFHRRLKNVFDPGNLFNPWIFSG